MRRYLPFVVLGGVLLLGCTDNPSTPPASSTTTKALVSGTVPASKHSGWWCPEHGIPEHECLMCLHDEEELKKKKDWCEIHDYAKSQCFGCDPKLKDRYAAQYRAKYGKEPPEVTDNPPAKNPAK